MINVNELAEMLCVKIVDRKVGYAVEYEIVSYQVIDRNYLELLGEILLENGYEKQLDDLFIDDAIYVENIDHMISINLDGIVSIMGSEDF